MWDWPLIYLAIPLSVGSFLLFFYLLGDLWKRRQRIPPLRYADHSLDAKAMGIVWFSILTVSFISGSSGLLVANSAMTENGRGVIRYQVPWGPIRISAQPEGPRFDDARSWSIGVPFLRYAKGSVRFEDGTVGSAESKAFTIPVWFLLASWLYWIVFLRRSQTLENRLENEPDPSMAGSGSV